MKTDPIEVLRRMRRDARRDAEWCSRNNDDKAMMAHHAEAKALDAAIASLSAPPRPEASDPVAELASRQQPLGREHGEVLAAHLGEFLDTTPHQASAPVGVEGFDKWFDEYTKNNYTDEMLAEAAWKAALAAQQPAPVAPVGVEGLASEWEKAAGELNDQGLYGCCAGTYEHCAALLRALAPQPEADCTCPHQDAREPDHGVACPARLAQPPAADPERIVLWSRGVTPNWYFIAKKAHRLGIDGMPVYETLDEIVLRSSQPEVPPGYVLIAESVLREMVGDQRMDQIRTMCKHSTGEGQ